MPCNYITDMSQQIWNDIGQPTDTPVSYIQTKLTSSAFLGQLNTLTANCYMIVSGDIAPALGTDEQAIYAMLYERDFWMRKTSLLANGTDIAWTRLTDGESTVVRSSIVDQMRLYRDMQKQLNDQLSKAIAAYRQDASTSKSVDFYGIDNGWRAGDVYGGGYLQSPPG